MEGIKEIMTHVIDEDYFHMGDAIHVETFDDNGNAIAYNGLITHVYDDYIDTIAVSNNSDWNQRIYACDILRGDYKISKLS